MTAPVFSGTKYQLWVLVVLQAAHLDGVDFAFLFCLGWDRRQITLYPLVLPCSADVDPVERHCARIIARWPWFRVGSVVPYYFVDRGFARWPWCHLVWRCRCGPRSSKGDQQ